jgi:hypothetical protein
MRKAQILEHWKNLPSNQQITPTVIPYKHEGSTYAEDGIRITGSKEFIDSVLSNLKPLLKYENGETRLQVVYQESKDRATGKPTGSYSAYIQVHERGGDAKMANALASSMAGRPVIVSRGY